MSDFYNGMAEILELEPDQATPDLALADVSWDSLAIVSTIALIDEVYGASVAPDKLAECETLGDVERLATGSGA